MGAASGTEAQRRSDRVLGRVTLASLGAVALWIWPLPLLLLAVWATELKLGVTAAQATVRRRAGRVPAPLRWSVGGTHLALLAAGLTLGILQPATMVIVTFIGAMLSIPAIWSIRAPGPLELSMRPTRAPFPPRHRYAGGEGGVTAGSARGLHRQAA